MTRPHSKQYIVCTHTHFKKAFQDHGSVVSLRIFKIHVELASVMQTLKVVQANYKLYLYYYPLG